MACVQPCVSCSFTVDAGGDRCARSVSSVCTIESRSTWDSSPVRRGMGTCTGDFWNFDSTAGDGPCLCDCYRARDAAWHSGAAVRPARGSAGKVTAGRSVCRYCNHAGRNCFFGLGRSYTRTRTCRRQGAIFGQIRCGGDSGGDLRSVGTDAQLFFRVWTGRRTCSCAGWQF